MKIISHPHALGRVLRAIRLHELQTQAQWAESTGIGHSAIAWLETGRSAPSFEQVTRIENELLLGGSIHHRGAVQRAVHTVFDGLAAQGWSILRPRGTPAPPDKAVIKALDLQVRTFVEEFFAREGGWR